MIPTIVSYVLWANWLEWAVTILPIVAAIIVHALLTRGRNRR